MVEHELKRGGSKTVVSITIKGSLKFNEFQYRMMKENQVEGILNVERSIQNEVVVYDYDVSGMQSLKEKNEGKKLNQMAIKDLYVNVLSTLLLAEEYFLEKDSFLIGEEFIYFQGTGRTYELMYCPEYKREIKEQLADLTEYIINHIAYEEQSKVTMVYELFKMFRDGHSTLKDILSYLKEDQGKPEVQHYMQNQIPNHNPVQPPRVNLQNSFNTPPAADQPSEKEMENGVSSKKLLLYCASICVGLGVFLALYFSGMLFAGHTKKLDFSKLAGVILLLGAVVGYACYRINQLKIEEKPKKEKKAAVQSVNVMQQQVPPQPANVMQQQASPQPANVMQQQVPPQPVNVMPQQAPQKSPRPMEQQKTYAGTERKQYCLVDAAPQHRQQYILYKTPYIVGKSSEQVDGVIYSEAVSRVHAEFIIENDQLYVMDMSSTNGTYVNRRKIGSNQRIPINPGDEIRIADKQFQLIS